jgi:thymidylate synthase ThyX
MKKIIISSLVATLLIGTNLMAKDSTNTINKNTISESNLTQVNTTNVKKETKKANDQKSELVAEAIESLKFTQKALIALKDSDAKTAKESLEKALGKLETILALKDAPKVLTIDSHVVVKEFIGGSEEITKSVQLLKKLVNENKIQEARVMIQALQSEIDTTLINLPLASYPNALKLAGKYIHEKKLGNAKEVLRMALDTFVQEVIVVPIPLLNANNLLTLSQQIAKKGEKKDKELALKYLDEAKEQLEIAKQLGYLSESTVTYKVLQENIDDVKKEIGGENKPVKLFNSLKKNITEFKNKILSSEK